MNDSRFGDSFAETKVRSVWRFHGDVDDQPLKEWLVHGTLPKVGKGLLAGISGSLKSFIACDLARAVITKTSFAARQVNRQGAVLLVAMEGQDEFPLRIEGIAQDLTFAPDAQPFDQGRLPFAWAVECPRLAAPDGGERLMAMVDDGVRECAERYGLPVALIIIDAMTSCAGYENADSSSETQKVMDALDRVARKFELYVLIIDHFGKDQGASGPRNSSVKEDASDAVLSSLATKSANGVLSNTRLAFRKVRGGPGGGEIGYSGRKVEIMRDGKIVVDQNGKVVETLVIDWDETPASAGAAPKRLTKSLAIFKRALDIALGDVGQRIRPWDDGPEVRLSIGRRCGASS
jgi:hypothetical protein